MFKYILILISFLILQEANAQRISNEALLYPDGDVYLPDHEEATGINKLTGKKEGPDACERAGKGRLPTIREWAQDAVARGAKGILEVDQVDKNKIPDGYEYVAAINRDGKEDKFYFNYQGYRHPQIGEKLNLSWSSSEYPIFSRYAWATWKGDLMPTECDNYMPVRCITD